MAFFTPRQCVHHFEFSLKTADLAARILLSRAHYMAPGGGGGGIWLVLLQEIQKLSTKTL